MKRWFWLGALFVVLLTGCDLLERVQELIATLPTPAPTLPPPQVWELPLPAPPFARFSGGFGIDYCGDDLDACVALGATWSRHSGANQLAQVEAALDAANRLGVKLFIRMSIGDWGWNGRTFDMTRLADLAPVYDHPALLGFYGLHEPLERFTLDDLRLFYQQFHDTVGGDDVLLWHDIMRIPDGFTDGICDVCGISTNPHMVDAATGAAINDWSRTDPRLATAVANMQGTSHSLLCVLVQTYGGDLGGMFRIPTPADYAENVRRVVAEYGVTCVANYAYHHNAYAHTLGDGDQVDLQTAVFQAGQQYFYQP